MLPLSDQQILVFFIFTYFIEKKGDSKDGKQIFESHLHGAKVVCSISFCAIYQSIFFCKAFVPNIFIWKYLKIDRKGLHETGIKGNMRIRDEVNKIYCDLIQGDRTE